jgi:hypothetical protein
VRVGEAARMPDVAFVHLVVRPRREAALPLLTAPLGRPPRVTDARERAVGVRIPTAAWVIVGPPSGPP